MSQATHLEAQIENRAASTYRESRTADLSTRAAGWGALTFALVVIAQNIIRGASAPGNGASAARVLSDYSGNGAIPIVLAATYVLSAVGLTLFLGGIARHLFATSRRGWAIFGLVGALGIYAVFALVVAAEQALSVAARMHNPNLGAIQALWALHNSIFTVLDVSIAFALLGLSRAAIAARMTPKPFTWLAPAGAALLIVGTIAGPTIAEGRTTALFGVAGLGFLVWLAFLIVTGIRLIRTPEPA